MFLFYFKELIYFIILLIFSFIVLFIYLFIYIDYLLIFILDIYSSIFLNNNYLNYISINEFFFTKLYFCFICSLIHWLPIVYWFIWIFLKPSLYYNQSVKLFIYLFINIVFFLLVIFLLFKLILPFTWNFYSYIENISLINITNNVIFKYFIENIINLFFIYLISFHLIFIYIYLYNNKYININFLKKFRKYHIIFIFSFCLLITPPDFISLMVVSLPILLLYEFILILFYIINKY